MEITIRKRTLVLVALVALALLFLGIALKHRPAGTATAYPVAAGRTYSGEEKRQMALAILTRKGEKYITEVGNTAVMGDGYFKGWEGKQAVLEVHTNAYGVFTFRFDPSKVVVARFDPTVTDQPTVEDPEKALRELDGELVTVSFRESGGKYTVKKILLWEVKR